MGVVLRATESLVRSRRYLSESCIGHILTYGVDMGAMGRTDKRINAFEEISFMRIKGVSKRDRIINEEIMLTAVEEPLQEGIERNRLRWYGHMKMEKLLRRFHGGNGGKEI